MELYKFLPKTNCKECGKPTCMAFALDLLQGKVNVDDCTPLLEPKYKKQYDTLKEILGSEEGKEKELRIDVDTDLCDGCGICVTICPDASKRGSFKSTCGPERPDRSNSGNTQRSKL